MSELLNEARRRAQQAAYINHPTVAFKQMHMLAADVEDLADVIRKQEAELFKYKEFLQATARTLVQERRKASPAELRSGVSVGELRGE